MGGGAGEESPIWVEERAGEESQGRGWRCYLGVGLCGREGCGVGGALQ